MQITSTSDVLAPPVRDAISRELMADGHVVVPAATDADVLKFQSFFNSAEGVGLLARLRSPALAQQPLLWLDPTSHGLLGSVVLQASAGLSLVQPGGGAPTATSAPSPAVPHPALSRLTGLPAGAGQGDVPKGAVLGAAVAGIAELTVGVDQTGTTKMLVTILGAVIGSVLFPAVTSGKIRLEGEFIFGKGFSVKMAGQGSL